MASKMIMWKVESSGPYTTLVVRRKRGIQQDIVRDSNGRIIWFVDRHEAQRKADELNGWDDSMENE
jgi:hypothetical protein